MFQKVLLRGQQAKHCLLVQHSSCSIGPTHFGTFEKHLTKLSQQVAAPDCIPMTERKITQNHLGLMLVSGGNRIIISKRWSGGNQSTKKCV